MNKFQQKYGFKQREKEKAFHKSRRMFCIFNDELIIAQQNLPFSHAQWFEQQGWITQEEDSLMDEIVRGYVSSNGNIYFYTGYDFRINKEVENKFFKYLEELKRKLDIKQTAKIFGGMNRNRDGLEWKPIKEYRGM